MKKLLVFLVFVCSGAAVTAIAVHRSNAPRVFLENFPNGVEAELEAEGLPVLSAAVFDYGAPLGPGKRVYFVVPAALCADGDVEFVTAVFNGFDWVKHAKKDVSFEGFLFLRMIAPNGNECTAAIRTVGENVGFFIEHSGLASTLDPASKGVWEMEYGCLPELPSS